MTLKLVYYGATSSGKTTNLMSLHGFGGSDACGRLMTLETGDDRTLFFDLLPRAIASKDGPLRLRIKLYTVPAQAIHGATRKLVLEGADGVAFIADSRHSETENSAAAFLDLCENLKSNGTSIEKVPLVIQFNKRDLPDVRSDEELAAIATRGREPVFTAVAERGEGVLETFLGLLHLTWNTLDDSADLTQRLGISGGDLLASVAEQLQARSSIDSLLAKSMGGSYRPLEHLFP